MKTAFLAIKKLLRHLWRTVVCTLCKRRRWRVRLSVTESKTTKTTIINEEVKPNGQRIPDVDSGDVSPDEERD